MNGYAVYFGSSTVNASNIVSVIPVTQNGFNPTAPSVTLDPSSDLNLSTGDPVCFRIKAYNTAGYSDFSDAACTTV